MYHKITWAIVFAVMVESALVMIGWIFDIDSFAGVFLAGTPMYFPTAVMFFISAIGLHFLHQAIENDYELSHIILSGISLLLFLINITIFAGLFISTQTGIENLFILNNQQDLLNITVSGLNIVTMLNFILIGIVYLFSLFSGPRRLLIIKLLGYYLFVVGVIATIGYVTDIPFLFYEFSNSITPMALSTALTFILFSIGLIIIFKNKIR